MNYTRDQHDITTLRIQGLLGVSPGSEHVPERRQGSGKGKVESDTQAKRLCKSDRLASRKFLYLDRF